MVAIDEHHGWTGPERLELDPRLTDPEPERPTFWQRLRRRRPRIVRPAGSAAEYHPGPVTRFFLWCGAVDEDLLETRLEYYRFANQGAFVFLIGVLASVSITLYLSSVIGGFSLAYLPAVALWAMLVFFLDRSIVAEPSYGDLASSGQRLRPRPATGEPGRTPATRKAAYGFRIGIAFMVAWLIGDAIVLGIFRPEINAQLEKRHAAALSATLAPTEDQIKDLEQERERNDGQIAQLQQAVEAAKQEWQDELHGRIGGTGEIGVGPESRLLEQRYYRLLQETPRKVDPLQARNGAIGTQIDEKNALVAAIRSGVPAQLDKTPELRTARDHIYGNQGWIEQEAALDDYLRENGTSPTVAVVPWLVRAILLAVDLLPLMLKLGSASTLYAQRMRGRAARICYEGATDDEIAMDLADHEVSLHHSRAELRAGVARQQDQWQVNRWIGSNTEVKR